MWVGLLKLLTFIDNVVSFYTISKEQKASFLSNVYHNLKCVSCWYNREFISFPFSFKWCLPRKKSMFSFSFLLFVEKSKVRTKFCWSLLLLWIFFAVDAVDTFCFVSDTINYFYHWLKYSNKINFPPKLNCFMFARNSSSFVFLRLRLHLLIPSAED